MTLLPSTRAHRLVRPACVTLALAFVASTAACGTAAHTVEPSAINGPLSQIMSPIWEGAGFSQENIDADQERLEKLVASCMTKQGFEYLPLQQAETREVSGPPEIERSWGSAEFVREYGYGIGKWPDMDSALNEPAETTPPIDPNQSYVQSLSAPDQAAYNTALWGTVPAEDAYGGGDTHTDNQETSGCHGFAEQQVHIQDQNPTSVFLEHRFAALFTKISAFWKTEYGDVQDSNTIARLDRKWVACMAKSGFTEFTSPRDAENTLQAEYDAALIPVDAEGNITEPDEAKLATLRQRELSVARADYDCRAALNYDALSTKVHHQHEQEFVDAHREALETLIAAYTQQ